MADPINQGPIIQGWCPGALRPMMSGDGLVVRIRPREGRVSGAQLAEIARLSLAHGNGLIDLSNRANLQLRGVTEASHGPLIEALRAVGLVDADEAIERRRNIVVSPLWAQDDGTLRVAQQLAALLEVAEDLDLPSKFGFCVDLAGPAVLRDCAADIRIERDGAAAVIRPDGLMRGIHVPLEKAAETALRLAYWFGMTGGATEGRGRMAAHVKRSDVALPAAFSHPVTPWDKMPAPAPGAYDLGCFIGFAFGQIHAETLTELAGLAEFIRITPWQMLLLEGVSHLPKIEGLITEAADPMRRVRACTGAPNCPQGLQPTRDLARALAPQVPEGKMLHVSGCAKGCAHSAPASAVLVAQKGGFDLVQNGRASDTPCKTALSAETLIAKDEIWGA